MSCKELWNHYQYNGPKTNNHSEGYHHKLNLEFNKSHPNMKTFMKIMRKHEVEFALKVKPLFTNLILKNTIT